MILFCYISNINQWQYLIYCHNVYIVSFASLHIVKVLHIFVINEHFAVEIRVRMLMVTLFMCPFLINEVCTFC